MKFAGRSGRPRIGLILLWAGEALAVVGLASLLLIRRADITSKAVFAIVVRSMFGIAEGLIGVISFWLIVRPVVIGFQIVLDPSMACPSEQVPGLKNWFMQSQIEMVSMRSARAA